MLLNRQKFKLVFTICVLLVTSFLFTSFASYIVSRSSLRTEISSNELPLTSDNIYSEIQRDLFRPIFASSLMANNTFLRDWVINNEVEEQQLIRYLKKIQEKYNAITSFFVSEETRIYYHADGILKKVSPDEERDLWYFRVREMKDDYEINVDIDLANKDAMTIFINYRVFDYNENYIGAIGVGLPLNAVKELIESYQKKYNRTIYFIDENGEIKLAGSSFDKSIKNISQFEKYSLFKDKLRTQSETSFNYKRNGHLIHTNIRYINDFKWHLIVEQSEQKTIKNVFKTLLINLAICVITTIVILLLINASVTAYQKKIITLRGIVPICSYCKQIRDDKGYWNQVEAYVAKHTDAEFSHSICPTCLKDHYPDEYESITKELNKG